MRPIIHVHAAPSEEPMRWIALLLPLALAACDAPPREEAGLAAAPEAPRLDFPGKRPIPVRLEMLDAENGRAVPITAA